MRNSKLEGKRLLGRPKLRWQDNIKMDLKETVCESVDCIQVVQGRNHWQDIMNTVMNFRILLIS
jgi:hypothetical protein